MECMELSFGEQVIILMKRQGVSVRKLASILESQTGRSISDQELARRLARNDFKEQAMREIAKALSCQFTIQMTPIQDVFPASAGVSAPIPAAPSPTPPTEPDQDMPSVESILAAAQVTGSQDASQESDSYYLETRDPQKEELSQQISKLLTPLIHTERKKRPERSNSLFPFQSKQDSSQMIPSSAAGAFSADGTATEPTEAKQNLKSEVLSQSQQLPKDCINPLTGEEYLNNTVRQCPHHPGYIQVYDRSEHTWTETNESEFSRFQQQKRQLLGKDYEPPIYI